ncbi:TetR/AcrR family transcriptional regulator [Pleurocapsa sp. FMAR1]|uniref:TetR/AcrR family transcriptional regulator n=1 Tax=Pleurocapsa sp. FMAR1 TaxID=3040204 RepID=UPI0029C78716|nr:TetR/AcrR family transcriptional regulator [Pleurocapsa sp. FMAR1]
MPNQTFFNLPDKKRKTITDLAIAEFASHDYDSASITKIVKQAKIAKGSFYQYFEDKKELYLYLVDLASKEKLAFLQQAEPPEPNMGFFLYLRWLFGVGTKFDLTHPALSQIVYRTVYGDVPFREEVLAMTQASSTEYMKQLVKQGIEDGDIATDINPDMAVFAINTLGEGLKHFIPAQLGLDTKQLAQKGVKTDIDLDAINHIFDDLFQILEYGLGNKTSQTKSTKSKATTTSKK